MDGRPFVGKALRFIFAAAAGNYIVLAVVSGTSLLLAVGATAMSGLSPVLAALFLIAVTVVAFGVLLFLVNLLVPQSWLHRAQPQTTAAPEQGLASPDEIKTYLGNVGRVIEEFKSSVNQPPAASPEVPTPSWDELNSARNKRYQETQGLFLTHWWEPSASSAQVADVELRLHQHGEGPLSRGDIRAVEYTLGPKFSNHSIVCTDAKNSFATRFSLWGSMLCLAKVYFAGNQPPLLLERYINLDGVQRDEAASEPLGNGRAKLSALIEEGVALRNRVPDDELNLFVHSHLSHDADEWEERVWAYVKTEYPALTGHFTHTKTTVPFHESVKPFLDDRIAELRTILGRV